MPWEGPLFALNIVAPDRRLQKSPKQVLRVELTNEQLYVYHGRTLIKDKEPNGLVITGEIDSPKLEKFTSPTKRFNINDQKLGTGIIATAIKKVMSI